MSANEPNKTDETEKLLLLHWERLCAKKLEDGLGSLSRDEAIFYWIWTLEAELHNGGFWQYMSNKTGDDALAAVGALREIGAEDLASICELFFALLPEGSPASNQDLREAQLDQALERIGEDKFDNACDALEAEFYASTDELHRLLAARVAATSG